MTIFEAVKTTVTPRMAAEHFGLNVSRNGMVCCPFHDDRHPSMKLYLFQGTAAVSLIRQRSDRHTQAADDAASGGSVRHLRAELPCADVSGGRDCRSGGAETEGVSARQVKTGKKFARRRNDSAKPRCSESSTGFTDARGFAWFPAKSRGSGKSTPLTYEEDIARRFSSGFQENRILHHTAKQVFENANLLRCFHHKNWGGFYEHQK